MAKEKLDKVERPNFTVFHVGKWSELDQYAFKHPNLPNSFPGKLFLKRELKLTGMEVSLNKFPPGASMPFYHKHQEHEELYIFIKGRGQFQIDDEVIDVGEGTVIWVAPDGIRTWRNNSSEDLYYIVIQAKAGSLSGEEISDGIAVKQRVEWPDLGGQRKS